MHNSVEEYNSKFASILIFLMWEFLKGKKRIESLLLTFNIQYVTHVHHFDQTYGGRQFIDFSCILITISRLFHLFLSFK